jgi:hypothetical protein
MNARQPEPPRHQARERAASAREAFAEPEGTAVDPAERHRMIAIAAYYLAERRGFGPGRELDDWHRATAQIDAMLAAGDPPPSPDRPEELRQRLRHALLLRADGNTR